MNKVISIPSVLSKEPQTKSINRFPKDFLKLDNEGKAELIQGLKTIITNPNRAFPDIEQATRLLFDAIGLLKEFEFFIVNHVPEALKKCQENVLITEKTIELLIACIFKLSIREGKRVVPFDLVMDNVLKSLCKKLAILNPLRKLADESPRNFKSINSQPFLLGVVNLSAKTVESIEGLCEIIKNVTADKSEQENAAEKLYLLINDYEKSKHNLLFDHKVHYALKKCLLNWDITDLTRECAVFSILVLSDTPDGRSHLLQVGIKAVLIALINDERASLLAKELAIGALVSLSLETLAVTTPDEYIKGLRGNLLNPEKSPTDKQDAAKKILEAIQNESLPIEVFIKNEVPLALTKYLQNIYGASLTTQTGQEEPTISETKKYVLRSVLLLLNSQESNPVFIDSGLISILRNVYRDPLYSLSEKESIKNVYDFLSEGTHGDIKRKVLENALKKVKFDNFEV